MELSRWLHVVLLFVVLLEALNGNFFVCWWWPSSRHFIFVAPLLHVHLFLLRFYCTHTYSCCIFITHAFVFATPLLCTCFCYAHVAHTPILVTFCYKLVIVAPHLHAHLFFCVVLQVLIFLCCYVELLFNFWPSCIATMHFSLVHDLLALLCYAILKLLTLLHCYVMLHLSF